MPFTLDDIGFPVGAEDFVLDDFAWVTITIDIVSGPYYVAIAQVYVPGAIAAHAHIPGGEVAQPYVPGAVGAQGVPL